MALKGNQKYENCTSVWPKKCCQFFTIDNYLMWITNCISLNVFYLDM